ncbi:MAG: hypothetical protein E7052_07215 [Lentisphaerae bacterium]|nr:hypothetical protein [Lentisphaerota bacterium]
MKKLLQILLLSSMLILPGTAAPKVQAFEPVTMVLLAPVALKVYEAAEPRLVKGAKYGGKKMVQIGGNVLEILYLPLGLVQVTAGAPFGFMSSGIKNIGKGAIAPGKMVLNVLALPFSLCGVNI